MIETLVPNQFTTSLTVGISSMFLLSSFLAKTFNSSNYYHYICIWHAFTVFSITNGAKFIWFRYKFTDSRMFSIGTATVETWKRNFVSISAYFNSLELQTPNDENEAHVRVSFWQEIIIIQIWLKWECYRIYWQCIRTEWFQLLNGNDRKFLKWSIIFAI